MSAKLINQDSGDTEYYTPHDIIDRVHLMLGEIDLDPASSEKANEYIKAKAFYSCHSLDRPWVGKVWLNHPFSRINNKLFIEKLVSEYKAGLIGEALCITYASTSEAWFRPLMDYPQCYIYGRTNYIKPDGTIKKGVTKGSVITYFGKDIEKFNMVFHTLGAIKVPYEI